MKTYCGSTPRARVTLAAVLFFAAIHSVSAEIVINGKRYSGSQVVIKDGQVLVDGEVAADEKSGPITIQVNGTLERLESDAAVTIHGDVKGDASVRGRLTAQTIYGNVQATGKVQASVIQGDVSARGSVKCNNR